MRLVENDEGARERAPAHEGQRRHFDRALFHELQTLFAHDVEQRVIERAQIGIDLLFQVARKKPQPLACLECRTREDQPLDAPLIEQMGAEGRRQIGLAGSRGPHAQHQRMGAHKIEVSGLRRRARARHARRSGLYDRRAELAAKNPRRAFAGKTNLGVDVRELGLFTGLEARINRAQHARGAIARVAGARNRNQIAAHGDANAELLLEADEIALMRAGKIGEQRVVRKLERGLLARRLAFGRDAQCATAPAA